MLELRPNCECCDTDLPAAAANAMICSFECTFCTRCATEVFASVCPNCGGNFVPRPIRPALKQHGANAPSTIRVLRGGDCASL